MLKKVNEKIKIFGCAFVFSINLFAVDTIQEFAQDNPDTSDNNVSKYFYIFTSSILVLITKIFKKKINL